MCSPHNLSGQAEKVARGQNNASVQVTSVAKAEPMMEPPSASETMLVLGARSDIAPAIARLFARRLTSDWSLPPMLRPARSGRAGSQDPLSSSNLARRVRCSDSRSCRLPRRPRAVARHSGERGWLAGGSGDFRKGSGLCATCYEHELMSLPLLFSEKLRTGWEQRALEL
jgi:hypothetical protein